MDVLPRSIGEHVNTPDGLGTVLAVEEHTDVIAPFRRYGVRHDVFPANRPRIFRDDILYYMDKEVTDGTTKRDEASS